MFSTLIFLFENSQNTFCCGPPLGPSWSVKYFNFGQKVPIRTTHQTFLEIHIMFCTPSGAKKRYRLMD